MIFHNQAKSFPVITCRITLFFNSSLLAGRVTVHLGSLIKLYLATTLSYAFFGKFIISNLFFWYISFFFALFG